MGTGFGKGAIDAEVAIIGYGPVGAMLANLLGQSDISTLVLERGDAAYQLPRAVHFDDEVIRVFDTIGLAEANEQTVHVSPGMRFIDAAGRCLLEWPRPKERTPLGWRPRRPLSPVEKGVARLYRARADARRAYG